MSAFTSQGRIRRILRLFLFLSGSFTVFLTTNARAEWYVGAYGGITNPGAFSNVTLSSPTLGGGVTNARINDLELKSGLVGGVKGGYFFNARPWLGLETDLYTLKPDVKQQTIVGGTTTGRVFATTCRPLASGLRPWPSMSSSARRPWATSFNPTAEWVTDYSLPTAHRVGIPTLM